MKKLLIISILLMFVSNIQAVQPNEYRRYDKNSGDEGPFLNKKVETVQITEEGRVVIVVDNKWGHDRTIYLPITEDKCFHCCYMRILQKSLLI